MYYLDYKATFWCRIPLNEDEKNMERAKQLVQQGASPDDIYNDPDLIRGDFEVMYDTETPIVSEDDKHLFEVRQRTDEGEKTIWKNTNEK